MTNLQELNEQPSGLENYIDEDEDYSNTSELYSISSFGIDYPVETLVSRIKSKQFYVPDFQREFIWSKNQASRFIESLLLGLPVPGLFLYKESGTGKHLIIDGQQRLMSLYFFFEGKFNNKKFSLSGITSNWKGKSFEDLDSEDQARLANTGIQATIFKQDSPKDEMSIVYEVFERLNTGGVKLAPQQIRSCIFHGYFNDFLHNLNDKNQIWREICGPKSKYLKDVEIILRFFAFLERRDQYSAPMKQFLNDYMEERRDITVDQLKDLANIFTLTMNFVYSSLGKRAFKPSKAFNVAVFDSVATSIAKKLQEGKQPCEGKIKESYHKLLEDQEFKDGYSNSTASQENVDKRFRKARQAFEVL